MTLDELYKQYGELTIKIKIMQGMLNQVEQKILAEMNKQQAPEKKEE